MEHHNMTVNHLVNDPGFRRWVLSPTSADTARWQSWREAHPEHHAIVEEAKELLLALRPAEIPDSTQAEERVWAGIREQLTQEDTKLRELYSRTTFPAWKVAASILICLFSAALLYLWLVPSYVLVSTAYGEIQELQLPDSSQVVLNANSTLRYPADWDVGTGREVWLEGEAFFKVKKRLFDQDMQSAENAYIKFTVHTAALAVEVLGTAFSVNHRGEETQVVLSEGKVRVRNMKEKQEDVILKSGEMLSYSGNRMRLTQVDASAQTSWKEALIILRNEPLAHIFERLADTYGYEIKVADKAILEERFSGSYPRDSVQVLLEKLEKLYQLNITENGEKINIRK